jgi:tetratricopeptide (TPR) repeat protein
MRPPEPRERDVIVTTTLTGSNADIIGDALASVVDHVDRCLVIDTGAQDESIAVARRVAGDKLLLRDFPWKNDFAAARNFALQSAAEAGAAWAITLDTDERLLFDRGFDLRDALQRAQADVLLVGDDGDTYAKERILRLPAGVRWNGPTHEVLEGQRAGHSATLAGVRFLELPKDPATLRRKFERDIAILKKYTRQHARQPRWFYYLGASHHDLGEYAAAIDAFRTCAELGGWAEEGAWACYRAAQCCGKLGRWGEAMHMCAAGLAVRPATAELAWLAGFAAHTLGRHEDAIAWSNMAIANGLYAGQGARFPRIGFRNPVALYEGPYDVQRWAYQALGQEDAAAAAARSFELARQAREVTRTRAG